MQFLSNPTAGTGVSFPGGGGALPTWVLVKKTADTSRNNATLLDDPHLVATLSANTKYYFRLFVKAVNGSAGDMKFRVVGPPSPTLVKMCRRFIPGAAVAWTIAMVSAFDAADVPVLGGAGQAVIAVDGIVHVGGTGGDLKFQWAQNVTEVSPVCTVWAGAYLEYYSL